MEFSVSEKSLLKKLSGMTELNVSEIQLNMSFSIIIIPTTFTSIKLNTPISLIYIQGIKTFYQVQFPEQPLKTYNHAITREFYHYYDHQSIFRKANLFTKYNFLNNPFKPSPTPPTDNSSEKTVLPYSLDDPWQENTPVTRNMDPDTFIEFGSGCVISLGSDPLL